MENTRLTPANVTDDREARPKYWVAAYTKSNSERRAAQKLSALGIETYVATQEEIHQWSDRKKKVERIVIPMTLFARITPGQERELLAHPLILKLLKLPGCKNVQPIPDEEIQRLQFILGQSDIPVLYTPRLPRKGDKVRVVRGSLLGLEGYLAADAMTSNRTLLTRVRDKTITK